MSGLKLNELNIINRQFAPRLDSVYFVHMLWFVISKIQLVVLWLICSAGVGRTGVFITLSIVLERMRYEGVVDIFQTVKMLRTQRPAMVQTEVRNRFTLQSLQLITSRLAIRLSDLLYNFSLKFSNEEFAAEQMDTWLCSARKRSFSFITTNTSGYSHANWFR